MATNFQIINPNDDPNGGRVKINFNFSLLSGATGLETAGLANKVVSGLEATYSAGSSYNLVVSAGTYVIAGKEYTISTNTELTIFSGETSVPRIDAIIGDDTPSISILSGETAENPTFPTIPGDKVLITYVSIPGESDQSFNGNRAVKRSGLPAVNAGGDTLVEWVENYFFPFVPATLSINSFALQEEGSQFTPTITFSLTPNDETIITDRRIIDVTNGSTTLHNPTSNSENFVAPSITANNTYRNEADVDNNGSPTTITSPNRTISFIYPFFYGMDADPNLTGNDLYTSLTKSIQNQGTKNITFNDSNKYIYIVVPTSWSSLSKVLDPNSFDVTGSFSTFTRSVTSSGLFSDYTQNFTVYRTNTLTTVNNGTFQFQF